MIKPNFEFQERKKIYFKKRTFSSIILITLMNSSSLFPVGRQVASCRQSLFQCRGKSRYSPWKLPHQQKECRKSAWNIEFVPCQFRRAFLKGELHLG